MTLQCNSRFARRGDALRSEVVGRRVDAVSFLYLVTTFGMD